MFEVTQIAAGLMVGFTIGLTGIGGGSLMTPLLILVFDVRPAVAVGTDLLYAALTKSGGIWVHYRRGHIDWRVVGWLAAGSLPTALLTVFLLNRLFQAEHYEKLITVFLGIALILTACAVIIHLIRFQARNGDHTADNASPPGPLPYRRAVATCFIGLLLGILVTASSVGAGALGTACLLFLYPALRAKVIVGTDLAHAVPLTAVAGLGHLHLGTVDLTLLLNLLIGSWPGVYLGGHVSGLLPERLLRFALAGILLLIGTWLFLQLS